MVAVRLLIVYPSLIPGIVCLSNIWFSVLVLNFGELAQKVEIIVFRNVSGTLVVVEEIGEGNASLCGGERPMRARPVVEVHAVNDESHEAKVQQRAHQRQQLPSNKSGL